MLFQILIFFQSDLLSMTIYDLVYEEDQTAVYNALLGPGGPDGQVSFSAHLRRGGDGPTYEFVHFVGYMSKEKDIILDDT